MYEVTVMNFLHQATQANSTVILSLIIDEVTIPQQNPLTS